MEYTIKKLGELAGVSTRTLRYYDQIGLLKPCRINSSGYRIYGQSEVDTLQQILFYREMGVELSRIIQILQDTEFNHLQALEEHRAKLLQQQTRINLLIDTVDKTICQMKGKGGKYMTDKEKFEGFKKTLIDENERKYGDEVAKKYGEEAKARSNARFMNLSQEEYDKMTALSAKIIEKLEKAVQENADPDSEAGLQIAEMHKDWLHYTWEKYCKEAHRALAQMYVDDERFTVYYDKNVTGCAKFLRDAVAVYCK